MAATAHAATYVVPVDHPTIKGAIGIHLPKVGHARWLNCACFGRARLKKSS
jgi:hypothetical protein